MISEQSCMAVRRAGVVGGVGWGGMHKEVVCISCVIAAWGLDLHKQILPKDTLYPTLPTLTPRHTTWGKGVCSCMGCPGCLA